MKKIGVSLSLLFGGLIGTYGVSESTEYVCDASLPDRVEFRAENKWLKSAVKPVLVTVAFKEALDYGENPKNSGMFKTEAFILGKNLRMLLDPAITGVISTTSHRIKIKQGEPITSSFFSCQFSYHSLWTGKIRTIFPDRVVYPRVEVVLPNTYQTHQLP